MQYTAIVYGCKNYNFGMKNCDIFLTFALPEPSIYLFCSKQRSWVHVRIASDFPLRKLLRDDSVISLNYIQHHFIVVVFSNYLQKKTYFTYFRIYIEWMHVWDRLAYDF